MTAYDYRQVGPPIIAVVTQHAAAAAAVGVPRGESLQVAAAAAMACVLGLMISATEQRQPTDQDIEQLLSRVCELIDEQAGP